MSTFKEQYMNISQDNVNISQDTISCFEKVNTQDNNNRVNTVQITRNADENVPFYCSIHSFGEIPYVLKIFNYYRVSSFIMNYF